MINQPNYTQCPNVFFDEILKNLSGSATKVFCVIMRKTFGWQKERDRISYSQIMELTGIGSRSSVSKAIKELEGLGIIIAERVGQTITFSVNVSKNVPDQEDAQSKKRTGTGPEAGPDMAKTGPKSGHTKESSINKLSKETRERVEAEYTTAFKEVIRDGEPIIEYGAVRKRLKELLSQMPVEKILLAISRAKHDEWIVSNGFPLLTILSGHQLNKLLNGSEYKKYDPPPKKKVERCAICGKPLLADYEEPHCSDWNCKSYGERNH